MRYTWLGYAAGVVALGLVALLGNFVFYSGDLVMHAGNWELARIVFPAIITVLGWFITILWAFHHARIVAEENRKLQTAILSTNHRKAIMDDLVMAYAELAEALHVFHFRIGKLRTNLRLKHKGEIKDPNLGMMHRESVECVSDVSRKRHHLKFNLKRLGISEDLGTAESENMHKVHFNLLNDIDDLIKGMKSKAGRYQNSYNEYNRNSTDENSELVMQAIDELRDWQSNLIEKCLDNVSILTTLHQAQVISEIKPS